MKPGPMTMPHFHPPKKHVLPVREPALGRQRCPYHGTEISTRIQAESHPLPSTPSPLIADKGGLGRNMCSDHRILCVGGCLTFGTVWQSLVLWELEASRGGLVHPWNSCGQGQVGTFSQSPEVLGSCARSWGWAADRWPDHSQGQQIL